MPQGLKAFFFKSLTLLTISYVIVIPLTCSFLRFFSRAFLPFGVLFRLTPGYFILLPSFTLCPSCAGFLSCLFAPRILLKIERYPLRFPPYISFARSFPPSCYLPLGTKRCPTRKKDGSAFIKCWSPRKDDIPGLIARVPLQCGPFFPAQESGTFSVFFPPISSSFFSLAFPPLLWSKDVSFDQGIQHYLVAQTPGWQSVSQKWPASLPSHPVFQPVMPCRRFLWFYIDSPISKNRSFRNSKI